MTRLAGYFAAGISQVTHTFNGMASMHHRQPGILPAAVENPDVHFQIIPDGVHVHPAVTRLLVKLVGSERVLVITDAMRAAGLSDGKYGMGDVPVVVKDGIAPRCSRQPGWQHPYYGWRVCQYDALLRYDRGPGIAHAHARSRQIHRHLPAERLPANRRRMPKSYSGMNNGA